MNTKFLLAALSDFLLAAFLLASTAAFGADGKVTFLSPTNGAMVGANEKIMVSYEAELGPKGDHLHLYLDGKRVDVLRETKGTAEVGTLKPGKHHICISINTSWHMSTGVEECIDVTAK